MHLSTWEAVSGLTHPVTTLYVYSLHCMDLTLTESVAVKDTLHWCPLFRCSNLPCSQKRPCDPALASDVSGTFWWLPGKVFLSR